VSRRKKRGLSPVYVVSIGLHLAIGAVLALVPQQKLREVVAIALNEAPEKKPDPPKPKPHPPAEAPKPSRASRARAPSAAAAQAEAASASAVAAPVFTDLGLTLDATAAGGLAVNMGTQPTQKAVAPTIEVVKPKVIQTHKPEPDCIEPALKPRPLDLARPSYTNEARRARVQGRVRIQLAVNEQGLVTDARILEGLGYGLDEEALAAARRLRFSPATRCSKPVSSPFVIAMRFVLGT
jgi:protein TonB